MIREPALRVVEFVEVLKASGNLRVLDVGCGSGRHIVHMRKNDLKAWGLDNSPTALRLARTWLSENNLLAPLVLADARNILLFQANSFDALISTQVIHRACLATIQSTASEIARVVRSRGYLLISVPFRIHDQEEVIEIEPRTYIPQSGSEAGLPHHIFKPDELPKLFIPFNIIDVSVIDEAVIIFLGVKK